METKRRTGPYAGAILLTLAQPAVWVYVFAATQASAGCAGTQRTGICDTRNELLAWQVPFVVCSVAVVAAWLLVRHANPRWQTWGVALCWIASLAALQFSWNLVTDVP